jgi:hypothetical protein
MLVISVVPMSVIAVVPMSEAAIVKWQSPNLYGATYTHLVPYDLVAENEKISGTRNEATISLIYGGNGPEAPTWWSKEFKVEWLNLPSGSQVIYNRSAEQLDCEIFKFRYATTLVADGTNLQFKVTGKVAWQLLQGGGKNWHDVDQTFTFKAYNYMQHLLTDRDSQGNASPIHGIVGGFVFQAATDALSSSHVSHPSTVAAAKSQNRTDVITKIMPATVMVAAIHGSPLEFTDSFVQLPYVGFLGDVKPEVTLNEFFGVHFAPPYNICFFYSCNTLSEGSKATIGYVIENLNQGFAGFDATISATLWSREQWIAANEGELDQSKWKKIPQFLPVIPLSAHAEAMFGHIGAGKTVKSAADLASIEFPPLISNDPLIQQWINGDMEGDVNGIFIRNMVVKGDPLSRLVYVYLTQQQYSEVLQKNIWWISL